MNHDVEHGMCSGTFNPISNLNDKIKKLESVKSVIIAEMETRIKLFRSAKNELSDDNAEIYDKWYAGKIDAFKDVVEFIKSL